MYTYNNRYAEFDNLNDTLNDNVFKSCYNAYYRKNHLNQRQTVLTPFSVIPHINQSVNRPNPRSYNIITNRIISPYSNKSLVTSQSTPNIMYVGDESQSNGNNNLTHSTDVGNFHFYSPSTEPSGINLNLSYDSQYANNNNRIKEMISRQNYINQLDDLIKIKKKQQEEIEHKRKLQKIEDELQEIRDRRNEELKEKLVKDRYLQYINKNEVKDIEGLYNKNKEILENIDNIKNKTKVIQEILSSKNPYKYDYFNPNLSFEENVYQNIKKGNLIIDQINTGKMINELEKLKLHNTVANGILHNFINNIKDENEKVNEYSKDLLKDLGSIKADLKHKSEYQKFIEKIIKDELEYKLRKKREREERIWRIKEEDRRFEELFLNKVCDKETYDKWKFDNAKIGNYDHYYFDKYGEKHKVFDHLDNYENYGKYNIPMYVDLSKRGYRKGNNLYYSYSPNIKESEKLFDENDDEITGNMKLHKLLRRNDILLKKLDNYNKDYIS